MKTKLSIICSVLILVALLVGVGAPWAIGKYIHHVVVAKIKTYNTYPGYKFVLKGYDRGIYRSSFAIDVTLMSVPDKVTVVDGSFEANIEQGPIIIDFKNKKIDFVLAKLENQIKIENTAAFSLVQNSILFNSKIHYNGKEVSTASFDTLSGKCALGQFYKKAEVGEPYAFTINTVTLNLNSSYNTIFPSYALSAKHLVILNNKTQFELTADNCSILNTAEVSGISELQSLEQRWSLGSLHGMFEGTPWQLNGWEVIATVNKKGENYDATVIAHFDDFNTKNIHYGPFKLDLAFNHFPRSLWSEYQKILSYSLKPQDQTIALLKVWNETPMDMGIKLNTLTLQMPGGMLALNGEYTMIGKAEADEIKDDQSNGKLFLNFSKGGVKDIISALYTSSDLPKEEAEKAVGDVVNTVENLGFFIDTGESYEAYVVYKKNLKPYLNGAIAFDALSRDLNLSMKRPFTPEKELLIAVWSEDTQKIESLLKKGVDLAGEHLDTKNPLQAAAFMGNQDIVNLLLQYKVPVDQTDYQGATALYWAASNGHNDVVQLLLNKGADPNIKNLKALSALDIARKNNHAETVVLLEKALPSTQKTH